MAVLADLGDQDAWAAALVGFEFRNAAQHALDGVAHGADLLPVDAGDRLDLRAMAAIDLLEGQRDLPDRRLGAGGVDGEHEQVGARHPTLPPPPRGPPATPPQPPPPPLPP